MRAIVGTGAGGASVQMDLDTLVNSRLLIQANSGAGKSWCIRRLLEQTHGAIQQIVIDPEGEFASLRETFDYVLAAKHGGDTAADPRSAAMLAERLLELGVSAVLDIYELDPRDRVRFVRHFLEAMVDAPKRLWHPVLVVLDEAHVYAPEQGDAESASAVKGLATRGRKRGFCLVAATQRLSKLHKDVAAECNNKLIGRTSLDTDMRRAGDELGWDKTQRLALRDLESGEFLAYGPALCLASSVSSRVVPLRGVDRVRVGAVKTTHPAAGAKLASVVPPPTEKVRKVLAKLADLPKEVEQRAATEADLRAKLDEAQRQIRELNRNTPKPTPALSDEDRRVISTFGLTIKDAAAAIAEDFERFTQLIDKVFDHRAVRESIALLAGATTSKPSQSVQPMAVRPKSVMPRASSHGVALPPGEKAVLTAVGMYREGVLRDQLGVLTGYKRSSRDAYVARLAAKGYVSFESGVLVATDSGLEALGGDFEPLPTGRALLDWWRQRLPEGERRVLDVLVESGGKPVDRDVIDRATGYKRSSRDAYLARLASRKLVEMGRGVVSAARELF